MFAAAGSRQRSPRVIYATWTFQVGYFVTMRRGADGVGAAGEIDECDPGIPAVGPVLRGKFLVAL